MPLRRQDPVDRNVLERIPAAKGVAVEAFTLHPDLFQHAAGSRISHEVVREYAVQPQIIERERQDRERRLGRKPPAPRVSRNPVAQLGVLVLSRDAERYGAGELARIPDRDCQGECAVLLPGGALPCNPVRCTAGGVRVRNAQGGVGYFTHTGQTFNIGCVARHERSQDESRRVQRGQFAARRLEFRIG